jgi:protease II
MKTRSLSVASLALFAACSAPHSPPPSTKRVEVKDTLHGVELTDPYRWLEDQESAETRQWIDAQNAYAESIVGESERRARLRTRLGALLRQPEVGFPRKSGELEYFTLRRASDELPVIYRRPAPAESEVPPIDPAASYEVVLDPHPMSSDHTTRVDILALSSDGKYLLYGLRDGGEDEIEVRLRDLEAKVDLPDRLPRALYASVFFTKSGEGFYYTHRSRQVGPRVRFHRRFARRGGRGDFRRRHRADQLPRYPRALERKGAALHRQPRLGEKRSVLQRADEDAAPIVVGADARFHLSSTRSSTFAPTSMLQ